MHKAPSFSNFLNRQGVLFYGIYIIMAAREEISLEQSQKTAKIFLLLFSGTGTATG